MSEIFLVIIVVVLAVVLFFVFLRSKNVRDEALGQEAMVELKKENAVLLSRLEDITGRLNSAESSLKDANADIQVHLQEKIRLEEASSTLQQRLMEHRNELDQMRQSMKEQFTSIASEVVFKNSLRMQEEHKSRLDDVLSPLKEKIEKFENQVQKTHEERIRENQSLREQLGQLQNLNKSIGEEARNLVTALKGQSKTQGGWGEMILESILERSGLVKDKQYVVQSSQQSDDGRRLQPDVIIKLPESRSLVIDAKVSLVAYERYCNSSDEAALKEHINSVRRHVKELGSKNYQQLYAINTLDFVLLFIPVEPAFSLAIEHDHDLFNEAFERNIVLVTTSTLLATLRTIASIWRLEYQNKNAQEIARQSGDLYDKFARLIEDLVVVGKKMQDAQTAYEDSMNKLHLGKGNLVARVENLKKLGVKPIRQINEKLLSRTEDLDEDEA